MFHGWPDSYMRQSDARILLEQFRGQKLMVKTDGGHHHAGFVDSAVLYRALAKFWPPKAVANFAEDEVTNTPPPPPPFFFFFFFLTHALLSFLSHGAGRLPAWSERRRPQKIPAFDTRC